MWILDVGLTTVQWEACVLSRRERRLLDGIEESLRNEDPQFADALGATTLRQRRRLEARIWTLVLVGAFVLCAGVGTLYFDGALGAPIAAVGSVLIVTAVLTARLLPDRSRPEAV